MSAAFDSIDVGAITIRGTRSGDDVTISGLADLLDAVGGAGGGAPDANRLIAYQIGNTATSSGPASFDSLVLYPVPGGSLGTSAQITGGKVEILEDGCYTIDVDVSITWDSGITGPVAATMDLGKTISGLIYSQGASITNPDPSTLIDPVIVRSSWTAFFEVGDLLWPQLSTTADVSDAGAVITATRTA